MEEVGAGKTLFYAKPNLLQASNNSYIILDPKAEILRDTGYMLEKDGSKSIRLNKYEFKFWI